MTQFNTRISDQNRIKVTTNLRGGSNNLNTLTNVDVTDLSNGDTLVYNAATGKWTATSVLGAGILLDGGEF
jgi:hypothetical protein